MYTVWWGVRNHRRRLCADIPPAYLKVHTASYYFLGNGKIRRFGCSLLWAVPKPCRSGAVGWGFSSIRVEPSGRITSKVVKSPNSESGATRVWPALKDTIADQFTAGKDMDEAAMEGVAGGGGGDGLASGSVRASDLDIFRDNPDAAASRAAPGRVDLPVSAGGPRRQAPHARPPESPTMHHAPSRSTKYD